MNGIEALSRLRAAEAGLPLGEEGSALDRADYVAFPLKCEFPTAPESTTYPTPLHTSDDPPPAIVPAPVNDLAFLARAAGWQCRVTYSEGYTPHSRHGTPSANPKKIWVIRLMDGDKRAVAVRTDATWSSLWVWSPRRFYAKISLLADFQRELGREW
jgi:hypothetical protein